MFEEGQLYVPVTCGETGASRSISGRPPRRGGPGVPRPPERDRRARPGVAARHPLPTAGYTDGARSGASSAAELNRCTSGWRAPPTSREAALRSPRTASPSSPRSTSCSARTPASGTRPAAGLVELRPFYGSLADGIFHSTQYVRHHSVPLYTPEPDVIHEVVGHGNCLALDRFAALYRAGRPTPHAGCETHEALEFISKVFWFSLEFGVVREEARSAATAPACSRSYGEIQQVAGRPEPLDIAAWECRPTTSPTTSRSCSGPTGSARSRTWSGRSSPVSTTTSCRQLLHESSAPA